MDDQQALTIVTALAHGANPQTGEVFASDSVYQTPDVIRALFVAQRALEARLPVSLAAPRTQANSKVLATGKVPDKSSVSVQPPPVQSRGEGRSQSRGSNIGKPWSGDEDTQLLKAFDAKQAITEIARAHGRTPSGICARLEKHGRLQPTSA